MNIKEAFLKSKELYKDCYKNIKKMSNDMAKVLKKQGKKFDPISIVEKFDIILQYSLLQIAVADDNFDSNELVFIRDLTEQGDLIEFIKPIYRDNFTWEDLYIMSVKNIKDIIKILNNTMIKISEDFIIVFAVCDKATEYDFLADLKHNIEVINSCLIIMDNDVSFNEINKNILIFNVLKQIKELKESK